MSAKSGSKKKSGDKSRGDAGDNDLVAGLKDRIIVLENMLRLKQEDAISQDTAEHKRMERELNLMQFSVEKASDEIFWMDSDGRVVYVNDATCCILGYSRDELLGMYVWNFDPTYSPETWLNSFNNLKKKGYLTFETKHKTRDGVVFPVEITANYIEYDDKAYSFAFVRDITERKRVEKALRESEAELSMAQTIAHIGSYNLNILEDRARCSDEFYRILGLEPRNHFTYSEFLSFVHPDDRDRLDREVREVWAQGRTRDIEYRIILPDGDMRYIHGNGAMIVNETGKTYQMFGIIQNITERKQVELAIRESEEKFRLLAETSPAAIFITQDYRFVYANPATASITGYDRDELMGMGTLDVVHPDYREKLEELVALRKRGVMLEPHYEAKILTKDGQERWMDNSSALMTYENKPAALIVAFDITERKWAEEALRKSEETLRSIIDSSPVPKVLYNEDENSYHYNKKFTETFGYTIKDVPTINEWWPLAYPDEKYRELVKKRWYTAVDDAIKNRSSIIPQEVEITCKDGSKKYVLAEFSSIGRINLAMLYDITEHKRAENALRESEERFRALADNIPNLAWMANADGWIFWYNKQWYDYTGTSLEEMQGWGWQKVHHPDYVKSVTEEWSTRIKEGKPYDNIFPLKSKDGNYRWFLTRVTPIKDSQGRIKRWFGTNTDITERKRAENALEAAKQQAELYLDLMSHDINNMHQIALGYLELAKDMQAGGEQAEFLDKPVEVLQRSARLIGNVQKMQKLLDGSLHNQVIDLSEVLRDVQKEFGAVPNKPITLALNGLDHCYVRSNELLQDVFSNLVTNAIKHTGDRTNIAITLDDLDTNGAHFYRVSVADNGPGIPDNSKGIIFNRVLKGTNKAKGMGLGLYLVKSLVENYGGRVWVEDRVLGDYTRGARFVVMLPAIDK